eukprot:jgi/Tetstr1/465677/TSEL_010320.t1
MTAKNTGGCSQAQAAPHDGTTPMVAAARRRQHPMMAPPPWWLQAGAGRCAVALGARRRKGGQRANGPLAA